MKEIKVHGFNFIFIKALWVVMKRDICRMMDELHLNGVIPKGDNASFFVLIPKVENPQQLNQFRPISLIGCRYKILAKILFKSLKEALPSLIDEGQSTFLGERNIVDSVMVANEIVDEAEAKKLQCCSFKADFEKAYDSVRWCFLYSLMKIMRFSTKWVQWIKGCIEPALVSVLVNGSPTIPGLKVNFCKSLALMLRVE